MAKGVCLHAIGEHVGPSLSPVSTLVVKEEKKVRYHVKNLIALFINTDRHPDTGCG